MMLFTNRSGWHQNLAGLADGLTFRTKADYDNYLKRLAAYPALNDEALGISAPGAARRLYAAVRGADGFEQTISGVIPADPAKSRLYAPFAAERPATISAADWAALQARARALIGGDLRAAYAKHLAWYQDQLRAASAHQSVGVSAQPSGAAILRLPGPPDDDDQPDRRPDPRARPVARSSASAREMEQVAKKAGFASREAIIADLRTNPKYYAKTPEELMQAVARETKTIDGKMPGLFDRASAPALRHQGDPGRDRARARPPPITTRARPRAASPAPITSTRRSSTSARCGRCRR